MPNPRECTVPAVLTGRFAITDVHPANLDGRRPAAAVVGECVPIRAAVFREGHDSVAAEVQWTGPTTSGRARMSAVSDGMDTWQTSLRFNEPGLHSFTIHAWADPWHTWLHRAPILIDAGIDVEVEFGEGAAILDRAAAQLRRSPARTIVRTAATTMRNTKLPTAVRLAAATDPSVLTVMTEHPLRDLEDSCGPWPVAVQRRRALVGSWYEFFPRSEGATDDTSGTFADAERRLPEIAGMGFDVVYLPPVHPIGRVHRKGPNNATTAEPGDPGSPWAIGAAEGGHDALHPDLGTLDDFASFVSTTRALGMEVALDLALQAAPDHPWVQAHPEWFTTRIDGTIAYAENPPKKYQDIYPLNFDNDPEGLYQEVERIVRLWVERGVNIFRVDNPHTKPLWVWDRLIASVNADHPDVLFLAEAFTRPPMMHALAHIGFQQSYTYFTWRNDAAGLQAYCEELAGPAADYMRPNFFVNTPDILNEYLQTGGPAAFSIRATLAACLSPTYGVYSGFELYEHVAVRPGSEEYLDSEKYQYRPRDWDLARKQHRTMAPYFTTLNALRRAHPALQDLRSLRFHPTSNPNLVAFTKHDADDHIAVICTVDPHHQQSGVVWWEMAAFGLAHDDRFIAHELLTDTTWTWGQETYVELRPWQDVAHIVHIRSAVT
jgi:starch synthase (maltosyl-transferring)